MRILLVGSGGQLGATLKATLAPVGDVAAFDHAALDLADAEALVRVCRDVAPEVIVNAAAYTAVDRAESEPALAHAVNARAPGILAGEASRLGALLVHYSTDYVFDGAKRTPYVETDPAAPLGAYGASKLAGEQAIAASGCAHLILRTGWVYAPRGRNFLVTMLRLAETKEELRVVDDQRGAPTSCALLARETVRLLALPQARSARGLYHLSAGGDVSWCGFARAIFERRARGGHAVPRVIGISTSEYPTAARRPAYSVLDNARLSADFGWRQPPWEEGLDEALGAP
jgi:dTDP-4-dehydrorhamnose reductase